MALETIEVFTSWCLQMGCSNEILTNKENTKLIMRSKRSLIVHDLMDRILPVNIVRCIKNNIQLKRLHLLKNNSLISLSNNIPEHLKRHSDLINMRQELDRLREITTIMFNEIDSLQCDLKVANCNIISTEKLIEMIIFKTVALTLRSKQISGKIEREAELSKKLDQLIPQKSINGTEKVEKAIIFSLLLLKKFLTNDEKSDNTNKTQLWKHLRDELCPFAHAELFPLLLKRHHVTTARLNCISKVDAGSWSKDLELMQARINTDFIKNCFRLRKINTRALELEEDCKRVTNGFETSLSPNLNLSDYEVTVQDYMVQLGLKHYQDGKLGSIKRRLQKLRNDYNERIQTTNNSETLVETSRALYGERDTLMDKIQEIVVYLYTMKAKIDYSKNWSKSLLQQNNRANANKTLMNLCRTLYSNDSSMFGASFLRHTLAVDTEVQCNETLPPYIEELDTFVHLNCQMNKLSLNLNYVNNLQLLKQIDSPIHLLTKQGIEKLNLEKMKLLKSFQNANQTFEIRSIISKTNIEKYFIQEKQKKETILEIIDQIDKIQSSTTRVCTRLNKFYNFELENSARKYVPLFITFNGRLYKEYESEYNTYFRIIFGVGTQQDD